MCHKVFDVILFSDYCESLFKVGGVGQVVVQV